MSRLCGSRLVGSSLSGSLLIGFVRMSYLALSLVLAPLAANGSDEAASPTAPIVAGGTANDALADQLYQQYLALGDTYQPRTEHFLDSGEPTYINRLIGEESPYLLQHAHNPVNWYPWGDEAFKRAQEQDKPIFLSIGYATCHWCHVMERESFENEAIAQRLNDDYIAIKVDREQLPDVDALFMTAVMLVNGSGGWPMSSFLDSEGKPFHGGTYYPPAQFTRLLQQVIQLWSDERGALAGQAEQLANAMQDRIDLDARVREVGEAQLSNATQQALSRFDDLQGGFGPAPKFPQESILYFLMHRAERISAGGNTAALDAVDFSLQRMAAGGIHDQAAGGFHRYAVDPDWLVPHFEKMLYNQASLARNYAQASVLTQRLEHERTARGILDYVLREMTTPSGLFYSATDADSEGGEGSFFTWTAAQVDNALKNESDSAFARAMWGISHAGNFEGTNILHLPQSREDVAEELDLSLDELQLTEQRVLRILLKQRQNRSKPLRDEKIITSWNALMITAFAEVGDALNEPRYQQAAIKAANTLWDSARDIQGKLWRVQFNAKRSIEARQSDYAFFAEAMLALYDFHQDEKWLQRARVLTDDMLKQYWDVGKGGFYMASASAAQQLPSRPKDLYDLSMPSGNSVAMRVLAKLYRRTGELTYKDHADKQLDFFSSNLVQRPGGHYYLLTAVSEYLQGEASYQQYAARGLVRARAFALKDNQFRIDIAMADGWHINSHTPFQDYLIATNVSVPTGNLQIDSINYPEPLQRQLGFDRSMLSLYDGDISLTGSLQNESDNVVNRTSVNLRLQACSDEVCLAPETLTLILKPPGNG